MGTRHDSVYKGLRCGFWPHSIPRRSFFLFPIREKKKEKPEESEWKTKRTQLIHPVVRDRSSSSSSIHHHPLRSAAVVIFISWIQAQGISDAQHSTADHEDVEEKSASKKGRSPSPAEMLKQLKRFGISGVLSYGLLNTAYYLTTFLFVWFYFAPAPGRMGFLAAVERFVKIMAMVWAGSQVTKLARAGGALALAPFVDQGLSWFTVRFKFESRAKAFLAIVGCCVGIAILLFLMVTLHSA